MRDTNLIYALVFSFKDGQKLEQKIRPWFTLYKEKCDSPKSIHVNVYRNIACKTKIWKQPK